MSQNDDQWPSGRRAYTGETRVIPRQRLEPTPPQRPNRQSPPPRRVRPRRNVWRIIRYTLLGIVLVALVLFVLLYLQVRSVASKIVVDDVRSNAPITTPLGGVNVLIVGVDERKGFPEEGVRGDTLIVAHLDSGGRWINLLSIPRDTLVTLPEVGESKINAAYGYGYSNAETLYGANVTPHEAGMAFAAQTVEGLLELPSRGQRINYMAQINFDGFAQVIDALGGITIDVPKYIEDDEYPTADFGTMRIEFQPGVQKMDGETALIYARTRHADSDFDRSARQQQVVSAIVAELRKRGTLGAALTIPKLLNSVTDTVATTLPFSRPDALLALSWLGSGIDPDTIGRIQLSPELDPEMQEGPSYELIWSRNGIQTAVNALLTRPSEAAESATVQVLNGTGITGLAGEVTTQLEKAGFTVLPAADAPEGEVATTVVYDVSGNPRTSKRLAELLKAEVQSGAAPGVEGGADIVVILGADATR